MLDEQRDGSQREDPWLPLLLGLVAFAERVGAEIEASADAPPPAQPSSAGGAEPALELLLGAVSLRRTLLGTLAELAAEAAPPEPTPPRARAGGGLLR